MVNLWGIVVTLVIFKIVLKMKNNVIIGKIPPTVVVGVLLIAILKVFDIDYSSYNESACILTILLGPATVALAFPLVENLDLLTKNKRAVYFGLVVATLTALVVTILIGKAFHTDARIVTSLVPKSVTTPIAVEISRVIGGIPELTACIVVLTGVFGAMFGHRLLKLFRIKSDVAKGLAIGASSHVLGTSTCVNRRKQLVMSTLALILTGILTTVLCIMFF